MKIDLTQGPILQGTIRFALPICLGNILQQLYGTVDTLIVGNFCGKISLAAVGTSSQPVEIVLCVFLGIGSGISILAAQCTGRNDIDTLKEVTETAVSFLYLSAIPFSIIGVFLGPWVLRLMQVPDEAFSAASAYVQIVFLGTLGNLGYNLNAGILRGMGDSGSSLMFLAISCAVNITLDMLFVGAFRMDVAGAALATSVSMLVSWILSTLYIKRKHCYLAFALLPHRFHREHMSRILRIGIPLGMNNSLYSLGHVFMQAVVNSQGATFMAACSVAGKVVGIANIAIVSLSSAATSFAGQNLGAGNIDRLKKGMRQIPFLSGAITCAAGLLVAIPLCEPILSLFNKDPGVLFYAIRYIHIVLPFTWAYAVFSGMVSYANGLGEIRYPTIVNLLTLWAIRIPVGYLIDFFWDGTYCMASFSISFIFGMISMSGFFLTKKWRSICSQIK